MTRAAAALPAIVARDLSVHYEGRPALTGVTFSVPAGTLAGVLGPNGAGKTTLLRALLGVVPYSGSAEVHGSTSSVPQLSAVDRTFPIDALGVVLMGCYPRLGWLRRPRARDRRMAAEQLERVGLAERARSPFAALSGGQRQRVLVARALAEEGEVMLLDEPLTGIDAASQEAVLQVLADHCANGGTVCMTTHDLAQAARVCDRLLILDGRLVAEGPTQEVFRPEIIRAAYGAELLRLDEGTALVHHGVHPAP